jgi:hypothetical protein
MFQDLYDCLCDNPYHSINITIKYDGAPAIFAWSKFPGLERPGIAMKGLFNKKPIIYTKYSDFKDLSSDLAYKLSTFIKYMPKLPENEIWQGDFLFDDKSIRQEIIDSENRYVFHPNTIMYVVPKETEKIILNSKVGVVWHTIYKGNSLNEASAQYNFDDYSYIDKKIPEIYMTDANVNPSFLGYFSESDKKIIEQRLHRAKELNYLLENQECKELLDNIDFVSYFKMFQNFLIKQNYGSLSYTSLIEFINNKFTKEIDSRKTETGKNNIIQKRDQLLEILKANLNNINLIILQVNNYTALKDVFLKKFNTIKVFDTYLKLSSGNIRKTNQEGFVVSDENGNAVKFIDRNEFSNANFSPNVVKGWNK